MSKLRVAVIGAGWMANYVHYPSLASFDDVEMVGICDLDAERMTTTADTYGIKGRYADYRKMVTDLAPDAVYAIGQPHLMYDVWALVPAAGLQPLHRKADGHHPAPGADARLPRAGEGRASRR